MNETGESIEQQHADSERSGEQRSRDLKIFTEHIYNTRAVQEERMQRANVIPEGWFWMSSAFSDERLQSHNPKLLTEGVMSINLKPDNRGFYTMVLPRDHDGEYNPYAQNENEIVVVAPPDYFLQDHTPELEERVMIFTSGTFKLVAKEDVQFIKLDNQITHTKRYYVVPETQAGRYHEALHHETGEVRELKREVQVAPQQYAREDEPRGGLELSMSKIRESLRNISLGEESQKEKLQK